MRYRIGIILLTLILIGSLVYGATPTFKIMVNRPMSLEDVCKEFLGTWNTITQNRVKLKNADKTSWLTGEEVVLPAVVSITTIDKVNIEIYTCQQIADEYKMTVEMLLEYNPELLCIK